MELYNFTTKFCVASGAQASCSLACRKPSCIVFAVNCCSRTVQPKTKPKFEKVITCAQAQSDQNLQVSERHRPRSALAGQAKAAQFLGGLRIVPS